MRREKPSEPMDWERPSDRYLAYLQRLSDACVARDREALDKLMRMRLSSHVPRAVLDELEFFRRATASNLRAPMKLMRYVHKMQQLGTAAPEENQLPLELRERELGAPVSDLRRERVTKAGTKNGERGNQKGGNR